jgi:hypothetical protein
MMWTGLFGSGERQVAGFYEYGIKPLVSIKDREIS